MCDQANMWIETKTGRVLAPFVVTSTTSVGSLPAGSTSVTVVAHTLSIADNVMIGPVSGAHESVTIVNIVGNVLTLATPLVGSYGAGVAVHECYIFDGFDAMESGKMLPVSVGIAQVTSLEVSTFSAGQGGSTTPNTIFYTMPNTDWFLRPGPQDRTPGWPATELWITNVPVPSNSTPSFFPGYANVRVIGVLGWPTLPDDIVECALNIAVGLYRARSSSGGDVINMGSDGGRTIERSLSWEDKMTLQRYSRHDLRII